MIMLFTKNEKIKCFLLPEKLNLRLNYKLFLQIDNYPWFKDIYILNVL